MKLSVITETELAQWKRARALQHDIIMVDDFDMHFSKEATAQTWQQAQAAE
jgi:nicotinate-nucleotide pyrophosphorylase